MNNQERKVWNLSRAIKSMVYEGFGYGSLGFCVGKLALTKQAGLPYTFGGKKEKTLRGRLNYLIARLFPSDWFDRPSFLYPTWHKVIDGHKFTIRDGEKSPVVKGILDDYRAVKSWEENTQQVIREKVKPGDVCLDVGASMGPISLALAKATGPTGKVIALEPTERCFNYLCWNIRANGYENIFPYKVAGWDKNEIVEVPRNDFNPIFANGVNISDFLKKEGYDKIDFVKIDVDGPETLVLKGLIPVFEANPHLKMVIEFYPLYIEGAGYDPKDFMDILDKYFTYEIIVGDYGDGYWNYFCTRNDYTK